MGRGIRVFLGCLFASHFIYHKWPLFFYSTVLGGFLGHYRSIAVQRLVFAYKVASSLLWITSQSST